MTVTSPAGVRTLRNYVGGQWRESAAAGALESRNPATGELAGAGAAVDRGRRGRRGAGRARGLPGLARDLAAGARPRAVSAARRARPRTASELARIVTTDMGKTLDDAFGEVGRGIESVEMACGAPSLLKGENLEGVARGARRRAGAPAGRRRRGDHAVQLPGDDPALVPALRARLRQHLRAQAVRAGPARLRADRRADRRRSRRSRRAWSTSCTARRDAVNGLLDHPEVDAISFVGSAADGALRLLPRGRERQARAGARRRQERDGRDARRRSAS